MAHVSQELKAKIAAGLKKVVPAGWKYSLAVRHHSTLVFTLRQAPVDILGNIRETLHAKAQYGSKPAEVSMNWDVNPYYIEDQFSGEVRDVMLKIKDALDEGNWDKSDIQSDYFNVGWYVDIKIGSWDNPFLDTLPSPKFAKVCKSYPRKVEHKDLAQYLPAGWASMTPGKKAHATKVAKRQLEESKA